MKRFLFSALTAGYLLCSLSAAAQPYFQRSDSIQVKLNGSFLKFPWAGGLNFVQVSNIDMNMDGIKDLFVFDRTGNKIRTFVNNGTVGTPDYTYAPEFENLFPYLHDWALLVDYNCDGKEDIFSFADFGGGIKVYKNISTTQFGLQFRLIDTLLYSVYNPDAVPPFNIPYNLYVSPVDIPAIGDVDGDGDVDIITFAINGTYLEYHQNQSVENMHGCDSLTFKMKNRCWGFAGESPISNLFIFNDTCTGNVLNPGIAAQSNTDGTRSQDRHSGNCELCWDLDGDTDKDIIIGNIYYNSVTLVTNGGTPLASNFVANDTLFPFNNGGSPAIELTLMPCAFKADVNNDGLTDLIFSPNVPNQSENFTSVVYYKNTGTSAFPIFQLQQNNLLQDNMIDVGEGAYPVLFDYDNDDLPDLFIGNNTYYNTNHQGNQIAQFHNIGTLTHPIFELVTRDYDNMSQLGLVNMIPTFGDMDNDGDADLIVGSDQGRLQYFQNTAPIGSTAQFVLTVPNLQNTLNHYIDVGNTAAPQIVDVDSDGRNDLVIGGRNGKLTYLHHSGTGTEAVPLLDSVTNFFGHVNVKRSTQINGYSVPFVFKQGTVTKMLTGEEGGYLRLYDSIDGNLTGSFNQADSMYLGIFQGMRTAPFLADLDNDGLKDMVLGNYEGGVTYYKGTTSFVNINEINTGFTWAFNVFPNPANSSITVKINNDNTAAGYTIQLINIMGQLIASEKTTAATFVLNTQNITSGMYFLKVSETNADGSIKTGSLLKKLVIQH